MQEVLHDDVPVELVRIAFSAQRDQTTVLRPLVGTSIVPIPDGRRLDKQPLAVGKKVDNRSLIPPSLWLPAIRRQCSGGLNRPRGIPLSGACSLRK